VDTGSDDGTQDLIRNHMAALGIPGDLHERPWRNFGDNRTEALTLAHGHGDYIWVIDADDTVLGTPDFTRLSADIYMLRRIHGSTISWRPELFRDGVRTLRGCYPRGRQVGRPLRRSVSRGRVPH
jgi:glycosyltransferase involved in cell wall biosynthesis